MMMMMKVTDDDEQFAKAIQESLNPALPPRNNYRNVFLPLPYSYAGGYRKMGLQIMLQPLSAYCTGRLFARHVLKMLLKDQEYLGNIELWRHRV